MQIKVDDLSGPEIVEFLEEHIRDMRSVSPPQSKHALDLEGLKKSDVTFWTVWEQDVLQGCGALKHLDAHHAEIKSMRTSFSSRGKGIASELMRHLIQESKRRGYIRLSLETGAMAFFEPARRLYTRFGFVVCPPFSTYKEDSNSVFMTLNLGGVMDSG